MSFVKTGWTEDLDLVILTTPLLAVNNVNWQKMFIAFPVYILTASGQLEY